MPKDEKQTMSLIFIYLSQMKICTLIISARESERLPADSRVISKAHCAVDCDIYRCCQLETEKERRRTIWYFFFVAENEAKKYSSVTCMWTVVWSCVKCCGRQIWCWTLPWSGGGVSESILTLCRWPLRTLTPLWSILGPIIDSILGRM